MIWYPKVSSSSDNRLGVCLDDEQILLSGENIGYFYFTVTSSSQEWNFTEGSQAVSTHSEHSPKAFVKSRPLKWVRTPGWCACYLPHNLSLSHNPFASDPPWLFPVGYTYFSAPILHVILPEASCTHIYKKERFKVKQAMEILGAAPNLENSTVCNNYQCSKRTF